MESIHKTLPAGTGKLDEKMLQTLNQSILEALPAAIYTCNALGEITYYNKAAAQLWGREPELGKTLWTGAWKTYTHDRIPLQPEETPMAKAINSQKPVSGQEIIIEQPNGVMLTVLPHPAPVFNDDGTLAGAVNMLIDITEKNKTDVLAQQKELRYRTLSELLEKKVDQRTHTLKESEERYHKMIEEVQDYAIILLDKDGYILNWNRGAEKIKGYSEQEAVGKNFRIFYMESDRQDKLPEKLIEQAVTLGRARHEGWRVRKDGTKFWGSIVITALHDDDNNTIGFSKVTRDLTEKKLADDQMQSYAMDIEFRNKQLEEYAYIASHDLQEPLRKIQVFGELLQNNIDNKEAVLRNVDKMMSSAKRMTNLIKDVLKYSQLSRSDEFFEDVPLNDVLSNVIEDFDLLIAQKSVTIKADGLPVIKGISIQLHQLFGNLVSNSIKFSSENPVIEIRSAELSADEMAALKLNRYRNYTKINFKDNGQGFEQQYGDQVFKMFKRLSNASGTGIGLALCKKIVENHNGHISVVSEPGKGTDFTIILPVT